MQILFYYLFCVTTEMQVYLNCDFLPEKTWVMMHEAIAF